jgi:LacI family transcriptional regulator
LGFGDMPDAHLMQPPLTTVRIPFLEIGRQLARMAIEKANSPRTPLPESVVPTELVLRGTTWPHVEGGSLAASDWKPGPVQIGGV